MSEPPGPGESRSNKKEWSIPLSYSVTAPFVLLLLFAVGLTGYLSFQSGRQSVNDMAQRFQDEILARIDREVRVFLDIPRLINQANSSAVELGMLEPLDLPAWNDHLLRQAETYAYAGNIAAGNNQGQYIGIDLRDEGRTVVQVCDASTGFDLHTYVIDDSGHLAELIHVSSNYDPTIRPWYSAPAETGRPGWSEIYKHFVDPTLQIALSEPLYDAFGGLVGVTTAALRLSRIAEFLETLDVGEHGRTFIIEPTGLLVGSSAQSPFQVQQDGSIDRINILKDDSMVIHTPLADLEQRFGGFSNITETLFLQYSEHNHRHFLKIAPLRDNFGLDWLVVVAISEQDFMGGIKKNFQNTLLLIALTLTVSLFLGVLVNRRAVRPLLKLDRAAQRIAGGDFASRVDESRGDEIGGLARSFNIMADRVQESLHILEQRVVELHLAQENIQKSEAKFRVLFEKSSLTIIIHDKDTGEILDANPMALMRYGYDSLEEMQRSDIWLNPPYSEADALALIRKAATEGVQRFEWLNRKKNGELFWDEVHLHAVVIDERECVLATTIDISERRQAEEALKLQKDRYGYILEATNAGTWEWNVQTREAIFNERFVNMAGYTLAELSPVSIRTWESLAHPDDLQLSNEALNRHFQKETDYYEAECRIKHKDGHWVWVLDRGKVISWSEDGEPLWVYGTHQDITERKRAEQALVESENKYRKILSAIEEGYYETDLVGNITFCNQAAARMLGYAVDEYIGLNFRKICKQPLEVFRAFHRVHKSGRSVKALPVEVIRKDGSTGYGELSITLMKYPEEQAIGFRGVARDITERRQAEQEREKLQAQLLQAKKMESVGILAGGVAHDFNNLLHAMRGNIELLLQEKSADSHEANRLRVVTRSMDRAAQLVSQLLLFGRKAGSRRMRVDMNQEVEGVARMLERTIPKMIALELHLDPSVYPLFADPVQIEQVLLNLARNASDAMPEGGKLVMETKNVILDEEFIRTHPGSTVGPHVFLTVSDTGCGMDMETLAHIFDPFFTTKEVGKGTGLGLASAYGIVQAHGGNIQAHSESGQGSTFRVYLPAAEKGELEREKPLPEGSPHGGNETILVVDDEPEIRELTREALESLGYAVQCAATGEEALAVFRDQGQTIDLVLLDLNMPGMGGHRCLRELVMFNPAVRVIIASGYTANGHGKDALASGAKAFLSKPYQLKELAVMTREVLDE